MMSFRCLIGTRRQEDSATKSLEIFTASHVVRAEYRIQSENDLAQIINLSSGNSATVSAGRLGGAYLVSPVVGAP